jgi:hypothetical protein
MIITSWGDISIKSTSIGYGVSGHYEGISFEGDFWEDENGIQENISFESQVEDKYSAILDIKVELRKFQYGG